MQRKIIAALDCGVELKDYPEGIVFTGFQPGREFSFPVASSEVGQLIEYLSAYRDSRVNGLEKAEKMWVGESDRQIPLPLKENPEKYKDVPTADTFAGRSAVQTVELKPAPNAARAGAIVRQAGDIVKTDLAKEVEQAKLTVQKR